MTYDLITANNNANLALLFPFKLLTTSLYCSLWYLIEQIYASAPTTTLTTNAVVDIGREMTTVCTLRTPKRHYSASISCPIAPLESASRNFLVISRHITTGENGTSVARYKI